KTGRQVPGKIPGTYRPESSLIKLSKFKGSLQMEEKFMGTLVRQLCDRCWSQYGVTIFTAVHFRIR
ncbi:hypothetical protein, partial [Lentilactobacillus hilgardii]|uniref:hypothetical protein n=1 Tax=Lentilactobacillus hilgardii TaxID=1588 RepID=UPI0021A8AF7F